MWGTQEQCILTPHSAFSIAALPLWMAAQTCYVNYMVEFATLMSTNLADEKPDYAGRQDLWSELLVWACMLLLAEFIVQSC